MKYIETLILLGLFIILPLDFANVISGTETTTIYLTVTGLFYLIFGISIFINIPVKHYFSSESYKAVKPIHIIGAILSSICIGMLCYSLNMKFTDFPGATISTILFTFCLLVILVISLIKYVKTKTQLYGAVLLRTIIFMSIGITALSFSKLDWIKSNYSEYPEYIKASEDYFSNPNDTTVQNLWEREFDKTH